MDRADVVYVCTHAVTVNAFLRKQIDMLRATKRVGVICHETDRLKGKISPDVIRVEARMKRDFDLAGLPRTLGAMAGQLRQLRPQTVVASTPKGGLVGTVAAWMVRVPRRIYHVRGLRYETATGMKRKILTTCEWLACKAASEVVCDSESVRAELIRLRLCPANKASVLGAGSACGTDVNRFSRNPETLQAAADIRQRFGIPGSSTVVGFVGRLTRDKGVDDLVETFVRLADGNETVSLLLVGDYEEGDPVSEQTRTAIETHPRIHRTGFVSDTENYFAAFDLFAFPSKREGFPISPLEAASMELPIVGYDVTGVRDAFVPDETGLRVAYHDLAGFEAAVKRYVDDPELRGRHGQAGRRRVLEHFTDEIVARRWTDLLLVGDPSLATKQEPLRHAA